MKKMSINDARKILAAGVTGSELQYHLTRDRFFERLVRSLAEGNSLLIPRKGVIHTHTTTLHSDHLEILETSQQEDFVGFESDLNTGQRDIIESNVKPVKPRVKIPLKLTVTLPYDITKLERALFRVKLGAL